MAGVFEWLDTLTAQVGTVAGKAVDVVGTVATARASDTAAAQYDETRAQPAASLSGGLSIGSNGLLLIAAVGVVIVAAVLLRRR